MLEELRKLLEMPDSKRDEKWEHSFFQLFPHSKVSILNELPQQGPDGFPYLLVDCKPDSTEPVAQVLSFASTKGIGLAVNPTKVYPDYIFTFGMLWNFRANGRFANEAKIQAKKVSGRTATPVRVGVHRRASMTGVAVLPEVSGPREYLKLF
jgi:hypothetical protein